MQEMRFLPNIVQLILGIMENEMETTIGSRV